MPNNKRMTRSLAPSRSIRKPIWRENLRRRQSTRIISHVNKGKGAAVISLCMIHHHTNNTVFIFIPEYRYRRVCRDPVRPYREQGCNSSTVTCVCFDNFARMDPLNSDMRGGGGGGGGGGAEMCCCS